MILGSMPPIEAALTLFQISSADPCVLWVNEKNDAARKFYERLGFREVGRIAKGIAVDGAYVDDVAMQMELE